MDKYRAVKGIKDVLPDDIAIWHHIERLSHDLFKSFNFSELRIPVIEYTELFARGIGETTDIVEKEMYTFPDRDGKMLTLRPEGTAGIVRAYVEHFIYKRQQLSRFYYMGPMFRHERPQAGRLRQFYQIGAELIGSHNPLADVEIIYILVSLFKKLEIDGFKTEINSLGCTTCRGKYKKILTTFLKSKIKDLCTSCNNRFERNPLRILDCKRPACTEISKDAPATVEHLCSDCKNHFSKTVSALNSLKISFDINPRIVRGLDYYSQTTFEIKSDKLGAQNAIAAGGRYDGLVSQIGGPQLPGVGFAMGMERLAMLLKDKKIEDGKPSLYAAAIGEAAIEYILPLVFSLRSAGLKVDMEYDKKSLKALMNKANQFGASWTLIIGEDELEKKTAIMRNMNTKEQQTINLPASTGKIMDIINTHIPDTV